MDMENEPQNRIRASVLVPPSHEVFRDNEIRKPSRFNSFGLDKEIFSHISDLCVSPTTSSRASARDSFSPVHQWFRQNWLVFALILGFVLCKFIAFASRHYFLWLSKALIGDFVSSYSDCSRSSSVLRIPRQKESRGNGLSERCVNNLSWPRQTSQRLDDCHSVNGALSACVAILSNSYALFGNS